MAEAAQGTVADIDGRARESADATRSEALTSATRVAEEIGRLERELTQLRRFVAGEADGLRAQLDRSRLLHASVARSEAPIALAGPPLPKERGALSAPPEIEPENALGDAAEQEPGPPPDCVDTAPASPAAELKPDAPPAEAAEEPEELYRPEDVATQPEELGKDLEQPSVTAAEEAPTASDEQEEAEVDPAETLAAEDDAPAQVPARKHDLEETRLRMTNSSDLDLAELFLLARARVDGPFDDEEEAAYWPVLVGAAVEEAIRRPDFGQPGPEDSPRGRKAKKQRAKALQPLIEARQNALDAAAAPPGEAVARQDAPTVDEPTPSDPGEGEPEAATLPPAEAEGGDDPKGSPDGPEDAGPVGAGRGFLSKGVRRRNRPFIDIMANCAVCGRPFAAGSEEALAESGWLVNDNVGLCPEDQKLGWELPEGRPVPYKRGRGS